MVLSRDISFEDVMVTLPSLKFLSSNFSFIRIHSKGRIQVKFKKSFKCKLPSMKYKSLKDYCIYGVGLANAMLLLMYGKNSSTTSAMTGDVFCLWLHRFWYLYWHWTPSGINHLTARKPPAQLVRIIVSDNQPFPYFMI